MARRNTKKTTPKTTQAVKVTAQVTQAAAKPVYAPLSTEPTAYGTAAYRTPVRANQFSGTQGRAQEAVVLDIDGTMQGWGGGLDKTLHDWCEKHYQRNPDVVFLVVTARDHEYMYESSFNWCMRDFPYAFIGPFCRAVDDPRLASEFKRQLAAGFEEMGLYRIVGAADDNRYVIQMWRHWRDTRNPQLDLLECDAYAGYGDWRSGLGSKGKSYTGYSALGYGTPASATTTTTTSAPVAAKNRPAGTAHYPSTDLTQDKAWGPYLDKRYGNVVSTSPNEPVWVAPEARPALPRALPTRAELEDQAHHANPHWTPAYIEALDEVDLREAAGITQGDYRELLYDQIAFLFGSHVCDDELDELTLAEIEPLLDMTRDEIEAELDKHFQDSLDERAATLGLSVTDAMSTEERQRHQDRMDLEDLAMHLDHRLTLHQAQQLDSAELLERINAAERVAVAAVAEGVA